MSTKIADFFAKPVNPIIQQIPNNFLWPNQQLPAIKLAILREDLMFPELEGNKFRKLKYHLTSLEGREKLLSVAGSYSNHLHALAVATKLFGLDTHVLIREGSVRESPTTQFAKQFGVSLHYIKPSCFRMRYNESQQQQWLAEYGRNYFIPEGGGGEKGIRACEEILASPLIKVEKLTHIFCAAGSGTMLAGLAKYLEKNSLNCKLVGISAVKKTQHLVQLLQLYAPDLYQSGNVQLIGDSVFKGFGKWDDRLLNLISQFDALGIPLEQIYTAKMMWYLKEFIAQEIDHKKIPINALAVHSGGLQGRCGLLSTLS